MSKIDKPLQVLLPLQLREDFHEINKKKIINSSGLVRSWIENYVEENRALLQEKGDLNK